MTSQPGADERRIRHLLRRRGVGYAPDPPADGWWADLYDDTHTDHHPAAPRTAPDTARIGGGLIPDWRKGPVAELRPPESPGAGPKDTPPPTNATEPEPEPDEPAADEWVDAEPDDETTPAAVKRGRHAPARRIQAAYVELAPRTRVLLYNGTAAGAGWVFGLLPLFSDWITAAQHDTGSIGTALIVGTGLVAATGMLVDRRTRAWWGPLPWICRIPLASALAALALYAPASTL